jgi:hypothetical protein
VKLDHDDDDGDSEFEISDEEDEEEEVNKSTVSCPVLRIRDPVLFLTRGSGLGVFSNPKSPTHISVTNVTIFWGPKKYYNSFSIGSNLILYLFKNKIMFNFVKFVPTKK